MKQKFMSTKVCAQALVHSLFLYSHSPIELQTETTERPGAGLIAYRCFRVSSHGVIILPTSKLWSASEKFLMKNPALARLEN